MNARQYWDNLMEFYKKPHESDSVYNMLNSLYSDPRRAYHNLDHIVSMLDELNTLGNLTGIDAEKVEKPPSGEIALAIWFHDAVYNPRAHDNEEQSALLAKDMLEEMCLGLEIREEVARLVLATKHRDPVLEISSQIIVDLDLAIFGKSDKQFLSYETAIRKEYHWVPEPDYCAARKNILQSFLKRRSIYSTHFMKKKYEEIARRNLEASIARLSQN